jgi:predicted DNA-binding protein
MNSTLSIRIDKDIKVLLDQASKRTGRPKSELVREALRRQLSIEAFQQLRNRVLPFAESQGLITDEDIWKEIS